MQTKYVVFIALLIDLISFTIILPLFPSIFRHYASNPEDKFYSLVQSSVTYFRHLSGTPNIPRWNSLLLGGLLGSLFSLMQFISSPLIGALSDVYGRKSILLATMLINALSHVIWAFSYNSFTLFTMARLLAGISECNASLSIAILTDVSNVNERGRVMALVGMAFSLAFIVGPVMGVWLTGPGWGGLNVAWICFGLSILTMGFLMVFLRESLPLEKRRQSVLMQASNATVFINPKSLFNFIPVNVNAHERSRLKSLSITYFFYLLLYSGLEFTLGFFTHHRFNYDNARQGKMFLFIGLTMTIVQAAFTRRIKPGKELQVASFSILFLLPAFILVAFAYNLWQFYGGLLVYSYASGVVVPMLTTVVTKVGCDKGTCTGILRAIGCLARSVGPILACFVYWSCGPEICYCLGAIGMLFVFVYLKSLRE